ncbi:MAG: DUF1559 domain-containing protein [Planctomycetales bacterium]|nr:DUF1559 domain-containing protein [Planctomycetales bacterium]
MKLHRSRRGAFTLVELLVVIAIIGVLASMLLPAVQAAREAARRSSCQNNLKQLALGLQNYHDTQKSFPSSVIYSGPAGTPYHHTWLKGILPYVEQVNLYESMDPRFSAWSNPTYLNTPLEFLLCPSDGMLRDPIERSIGTVPVSITNYSGSAGLIFGATQLYPNASVAWDGQAHWTPGSFKGDYSGVFAPGRFRRMSDLKDGSSNIVLVAETNATGYAGGTNSGQGDPRFPDQAYMRTAFLGSHAMLGGTVAPDGSAWPGSGHFQDAVPYSVSPVFAARNGINSEWHGASSMHTGGIVLHALADGSVRQISDTVDYKVIVVMNGINTRVAVTVP